MPLGSFGVGIRFHKYPYTSENVKDVVQSSRRYLNLCCDTICSNSDIPAPATSSHRFKWKKTKLVVLFGGLPKRSERVQTAVDQEIELMENEEEYAIPDDADDDFEVITITSYLIHLNIT